MLGAAAAGTVSDAGAGAASHIPVPHGTVNPALHDLSLDTAIRDWVLLPILVATLLFALIREFGSRLMRAEPKRDKANLIET